MICIREEGRSRRLDCSGEAGRRQWQKGRVGVWQAAAEHQVVIVVGRQPSAAIWLSALPKASPAASKTDQAVQGLTCQPTYALLEADPCPHKRGCGLLKSVPDLQRTICSKKAHLIVDHGHVKVPQLLERVGQIGMSLCLQQASWSHQLSTRHVLAKWGPGSSRGCLPWPGCTPRPPREARTAF